MNLRELDSPLCIGLGPFCRNRGFCRHSWLQSTVSGHAGFPSCVGQVSHVPHSRTAALHGLVCDTLRNRTGKRSLLDLSWRHPKTASSKWELKPTLIRKHNRTTETNPSLREWGVCGVIQKSALWQHLINYRFNVPAGDIIAIRPQKNNDPQCAHTRSHKPLTQAYPEEIIACCGRQGLTKKGRALNPGKCP